MNSLFFLSKEIILLVSRYIKGTQKERQQISFKIKAKLKSLGLALAAGIGGVIVTIFVVLVCIKLLTI